MGFITVLVHTALTLGHDGVILAGAIGTIAAVGSGTFMYKTGQKHIEKMLQDPTQQ